MWWKFLKAIRSGQWKLNPTTWITAIGAVLYTITPVDLIPELFVGPLGFVDDLGLWGVVVMLATREKTQWEQSLAANEEYIDVTPVDEERR